MVSKVSDGTAAGVLILAVWGTVPAFAASIASKNVRIAIGVKPPQKDFRTSSTK